jgi:hypothetical protein
LKLDICRAVIAYYVPETGAVIGSYCIYNGDVGRTGVILQLCYNSDELASEIADIGAFAVLKRTYKQTWNVCDIHGDLSFWPSVDTFLRETDAEFLYLWDGEAWFVSRKNSDDIAFTALEDLFKKTT